MTEGQEGMPSSPEAQRPETPEPFQPSWIMERKGEDLDMNPKLGLRARLLHETRGSVLTPGFLRIHFRGIQGEVLRGEVPENEAIGLLAKISDKIEELDSQKEAQQGQRRPPRSQSEFSRAVDTMTAGVGDLSRTLGELKVTMEKSGQLQPALTPEQIAQMTAAQMKAYSQQQTEQMRSVFGRMDPLAEESRWVDVEYSQEFYTRFTPNMEPRFYTEISSGSERGIWDARWRLARAAYVKKVLSAQPEKLCENQDLIELTKEQMETLYKIPGVKFALEWYARAIVSPGDEHKIEDKTVLECKSGEDFEGFRKLLRSKIRTLPKFNIQEKEEEKMSLEDRTRLMSADAIAWNLIWCSNLVESVDSRYSITDVNGTRHEGEGRHAKLAPAVCSDDLRAVFHPQEKFEDKCRKNQAWGNFGRWGLTQTDRIKREQKFDLDNAGKYIKDKDKILFESALKKTDYWRAERTGGKVVDDDGKEKEVIKVYAPECYPITSMKSFWEAFDDKDGEGIKKSLLERLLGSQDINWDSVDADPWKTSYLTINLRKAVGLFDYFTKESKEGWARALLDIYTRLGTYNILKDYYKTSGLSESEHESERLAGIHFHNLKVWAVYAVQGGVGRPQDKEVTDPYSRSRIEAAHQWNRSTHASILRQPQIGYLEDRGLFDKEDLVIMSLQ